MKLLLILFSVFLIAGTASKAQVVIDESLGISEMLAKRESIYRSSPKIDGWRVQLLASTDRIKVMELKARFLQKYPFVSADWDFNSPYYKMKVGSYLTKLEAYRLRHRIRYDFPDAYVIRDKVSPRDL